ncbi:hypothetical protein [Roseiflexus sp.]|uniref:hypothetical protein n=1 Tax=Roseiflexus sp. TaxID=2562120 RepID=UPI00398A5A8F
MPNRDWQHAEERAAHLIDERQRYVEGAIIDWLIRTGQWDPLAEEKIRAWLERQAAEMAENERRANN